jgi:uncharacterized protein (DUF934 family)
MAAIIKDGKIVGNDWTHAGDGDTLPEGNATVTLQRWQAEKDALAARNAPLGIRLGTADAPEAIAGDLARFSLIVLEFPKFTDGRVFSQARLLRERYGYTGELRVRGDFLRDQLFYLSRVGVNAFEFPDETNLEDVLPSFSDFTVRYQAATDVREPLYRRRA